MNSLFRAVLVLPTMSVLGAALPHSVAGVPTPRTAPQRLVAEAPIWGSNNAQKGYAFLPVTLQGHAATLMIDLNCTQCDIRLSTAAMTQAGMTPPASNATSLDALTIGNDVQHNVPIAVNPQAGWAIHGPENTATIIGTVGVHFLVTHYDILYDFPHRRVRLYAMPPKPVDPKNAWLPDGFKPTDCGRMIDIPPGAATFTGVEMKIDGHPVTGALEMGPYIPKMNETAFKTLGLPANSPRVQPGQPGEADGHPLLSRVSDVQMTVGTNMFSTWDNEVLSEVDAQSLLPGNPPVMLMNLSMMRNVMLFNSTSSKQVCITKPAS